MRRVRVGAGRRGRPGVRQGPPLGARRLEVAPAAVPHLPQGRPLPGARDRRRHCGADLPDARSSRRQAPGQHPRARRRPRPPTAAHTGYAPAAAHPAHTKPDHRRSRVSTPEELPNPKDALADTAHAQMAAAPDEDREVMMPDIAHRVEPTMFCNRGDLRHPVEPTQVHPMGSTRCAPPDDARRSLACTTMHRTAPHRRAPLGDARHSRAQRYPALDVPHRTRCAPLGSGARAARPTPCPGPAGGTFLLDHLRNRRASP